MQVRLKSIEDESSINTANIPHPHSHMLLPGSTSGPSWLHPPWRCLSSDVWLHPQSSHWLLFLFTCVGWTKRHLVTKKERLEWVFLENNQRNKKPPHCFIVAWISKEFVANHETWPHYFILMSCHTWQKCDAKNTCKIFVSICSFPSVPSSRLGLHWICAVGGWGCEWGGGMFKGIVASQMWMKATKHQDSCMFYLWDRLMKQNGHVCRFFACSGMAKGW